MMGKPRHLGGHTWGGEDRDVGHRDAQGAPRQQDGRGTQAIGLADAAQLDLEAE